MTTRALLHGRMVGLGIVLLTVAFQGSPSAQQGADPSLRVGASDLGGVVTSANGSEAGVWVIAETNDLPTKLAKIVVTDEHGRYLIPDLPKASIACGCAAMASSTRRRRRRRPESASTWRQSGRQAPRRRRNTARRSTEGGKGTTSKAVKFQLRPDPLAR